MPVAVLALPQPPAKSVIFPILHLRNRRLRKLSARLRSRSWGSGLFPTSPWDLANPPGRQVEGSRARDTREHGRAARLPVSIPRGAPAPRHGAGRRGLGPPCHEGRHSLWSTPRLQPVSRSVLSTRRARAPPCPSGTQGQRQEALSGLPLPCASASPLPPAFPSRASSRALPRGPRRDSPCWSPSGGAS